MQRPRILIVDDEPEVLTSITQFLERNLEGDVEVASDGRAALAAIDAGAFDVILLDVKMAGISGMDVLKKVKQTHPSIDVLMISGWDSKQVAHEAIKEGALDYIVKPSSIELIFSKLRAILEKRGQFLPKTSAGPTNT